MIQPAYSNLPSPATNVFDWVIPPTPATTARVRVTSVLVPTLFDSSDFDFISDVPESGAPYTVTFAAVPAWTTPADLRSCEKMK